jgi:flagellar biosynthesis protein FlhB
MPKKGHDMRVAVLLLRLLGIGMVLYAGYTVYMLHAMARMMDSNVSELTNSVNQQGGVFGQFGMAVGIVYYGILFIGIVFALFSARMCRLLTFDYRD